MEVNRKNQLINEVELLLGDLDVNSPAFESLEWYLRNNLADYLKKIKTSENSHDLKIATKILSRFCLESMDWDTPLFKRCTKITEFGLKLAKNE